MSCLVSHSAMGQLSLVGIWRQVPMRTASLADTGAFLVSSGNRQTFAPGRGTVTQPMAAKPLKSRSHCSCVNY